MSVVSLPVTRPIGRALLVAAVSHRAQPLELLQSLGYSCAEADNPYHAMVELARHPAAYRAIILSLASLYREELAIVQAVKQRFGSVEVWLTQVDGRQASLAEAMRMGADGLLADDGLHRLAVAPDSSSPAVSVQLQTDDAIANSESHQSDGNEIENDIGIGEPVLTADELRALLQEHPISDRET